MIRVSVGYGGSGCNVGIKSVAGKEFIDASTDEGVSVSSIAPSSCVVTFLWVTFMPDVDKVILCGECIEGVDSTSSGVKVTTNLVQFGVRN